MISKVKTVLIHISTSDITSPETSLSLSLILFPGNICLPLCKIRSMRLLKEISYIISAINRCKFMTSHLSSSSVLY